MIIPHKYIGLSRQVIAGTAASLGLLACAAVFGWVTPILPHLLSPDSEIPMTEEESSWMLTMPEFVTLVTCVPMGKISDHFGRKIVMILAAPIFLLGWIIILYFKTLLALDIARNIQGVGVGMVYTVTPMYLGEISSPKYRGAVTSIFYAMWWFGFLFEYLTGPILSFSHFTYVTAFTNVVFFVSFIFQPESPYYYLMKNDVDNARKSLQWFRNSSKVETEIELEDMKRNVEEERKKEVKWNELLATWTDRKALLILFIVGYLREYCGLIPMSCYSTQTLDAANVNFFISPDNITVAMGIAMLIGSVISSFTLDYCGRVSLLFFSCTVSGIAMFCTGTFYWLHVYSSIDVTGYSWVPPFCLIVLACVSVIGIFPVSVAYGSELFTSNTRGMANGVFAFYTTFINIFCFKFYLTFANEFGIYINFYIYAISCFFGSVLSLFFMPETKGKTFEQIRHDLHQH